jgi:putative Mg2+ transporter-C (MgtC) family protein
VLLRSLMNPRSLLNTATVMHLEPGMLSQVHWQDIVLRLLLAAIAGGLIGVDRGEHGQPAGLRTTVLVCVAAAVAMVQANLLLNTNGKTSGSFAVADVLRLPLGILSGMGFIGAGAILRRDNMIAGVTTAATLWFVTVMGLCFGGGQVGLGLGALGLGVSTLRLLRHVEPLIPRDQQATLEACVEGDGAEADLRAALQEAGMHTGPVTVTFTPPDSRRELVWRVQWHTCRTDKAPAFVAAFARRGDVRRISWRPEQLPGVK